MDFKETDKFIPYDQVPPATIKTISDGLLKFPKNHLKQILIKYFSEDMKEIIIKELPKSSMEIISLLQYPDCLVVVTFKRYPFKRDIGEKYGFAGLARIIKTPILIPVIYLMNNRNEETFAHEKIHVCQYLLNEAYPLTSDQRTVYHLPGSIPNKLNQILSSAGKGAAMDFLFNVACYKTWIELEANHYTKDITESYNVDDWMKKVYASSLPISTIEQGLAFLGGKNDDMEMAGDKFRGYCAEMEREVDWVRTLVEKSFYSNLHELIIETHDTFETEMIFGPLDFDGEGEEAHKEYDESESLSDKEFLKKAKKELERINGKLRNCDMKKS